MLVLGVFGITNDGLNLAVNLLILCVVVVYLASVYWTYADARRRMLDPMLIGCATAASFFPFVGTLVYMIVRPPEYLEDIRERELEMQAAEARLHSAGFQLCPHCDAEIERDFLKCPSCMRKLKEPCASCGRPLEQGWRVCPYCEAEIAPSQQRRAKRPRARAGTGANSGKTADAPPVKAAEPDAAPKVSEAPQG